MSRLQKLGAFVQQTRSIALLAIVALASSNEAWSLDVKGSDLIVKNSYGIHSFHWLDNDRVIALVEAESWKSPEGIWKPLERLVVWDVSSDKQTEIAGSGAGGLCVGKGFIRYFVRKVGEGKYDEFDRYAGPLGKQEKVQSEPIDLDSCLPEREIPALPAWTKGKYVKRLRGGDGFVVYEKFDHEQRPTKLYKLSEGEEAGTVLPDVFSAHSPHHYHMPSLPAYFAYKQAYLLHSTHFLSPLKEGEPATLWWLYPDGRVEEIIRYVRTKGWPYANPNGVIPTKSGIVFVGADTKSIVPRIGTDGLYRLQPGALPRRIIAGRIGAYALSPDGCRLAFGNDERPYVKVANWIYKLQVVNLCEGERK